MKKILLFTAVALFALTSAKSQEFRLGAKAGLNVASLGGDSIYEKAASPVSLKFTKTIRYENRTHCPTKVIHWHRHSQT